MREGLSSFPLIEQYLGDHIRRLEATPPEDGRFAKLFSRGDPRRLENRLQRTRTTHAFSTIFQEIGKITDSVELDRRLLDAWAEIRVIDQLLRERFADIRKVRSPADFVARYLSQLYAVQVTRISREVSFPDTPRGNLTWTYDKVQELVGSYFWDSITDKNLQLKNASPEYTSRITVVTSISHLQNPLNRHIACRQIRDSIAAVQKRYFDEVQWLPDLGNGAVFWCETSGEEERVRCVVDWRDDSSPPPWSDCRCCHWREVDLESDFPAYLSEVRQNHD